VIETDAYLLQRTFYHAPCVVDSTDLQCVEFVHLTDEWTNDGDAYMCFFTQLRREFCELWNRVVVGSMQDLRPDPVRVVRTNVMRILCLTSLLHISLYGSTKSRCLVFSRPSVGNNVGAELRHNMEHASSASVLIVAVSSPGQNLTHFFKGQGLNRRLTVHDM
jgi:hypothetical protein